MTSTDPAWDKPGPAGAEPRLRRTRQRTEIRDAVEASSSFATSQEIHDRMRRDGSRVGLATVYRTLQALVSNGELDSIRTPDGQIAYRTCTPGHHHHLVCRRCGRTVEISLPGLEELTRNIAGMHGFAEIDHEVEFFGLCAACHG